MFLALSLLSLFSFVQAQNGTTDFEPFSVAARCPFPCSSDKSGWAAYHDLSELNGCKKTILLDLNVYFKVPRLESLFAMRGCLADGSSPEAAPKPKLARRQMLVPPSASGNSTKSSFELRNQTADIEIVRYNGVSTQDNEDGAPADSASISAAAAAIGGFLKSEENGEPTTLFARSGNAVIGVYAGAQIDMASVGSIVNEFARKATGRKADQTTAQLCKDGYIGTQIFGIFLSTKGDLGSARDAVKGWRDAECFSGKGGEKESWKKAPLATIPGKEVAVGPDTSDNDHVDKRATCSYTQVQSGDGCWALADRCKITQEQLVKFNPKPNFCNGVQAGQYVCCSAGDLPDFSPQPNPDGSCKTITFNGDFCGVIAEKNKMTVEQIEERNKNTWAWGGCGFLQPGQVFCLSKGSPPMPPPLSNAVCGPQVPGTKKPANLDDLASLNPCPIKACCNVWGQCGTNKDFCIKNPGDTGAPGTTQPGANSCIYNCGMDIVNNKSPPSTYIKLGYFEAFNPSRPCLHMRPKHIDSKRYSHVHYAFGGISENFEVDMSGQEQMFKEFKEASGFKKIMSFGGWSFSTESDTFPIFRKGVTAAQRLKFAENCVKFLVDNNLDGLDFDWEYPGAPDIPGIPPGDKEDGPNYLSFLQLVKRRLPAGKTLSIAAPASYWYLKAFPIEDIGKVCDYIVYMTYDIHGQWDYGNEWTSEGCKGGNCLRSHVNRTETESAMVMITKAGVQANKVLIGMALYGRTFKMVDPSCRGPNCRFTGPESGAAKGRCTGTAGYISNFELREIINDGKATQWSDKDGDYATYFGDNWVSWMTPTTYDRRASWVKGLNFGGTVDWAMDLDANYGSNDGPGGGDSGSGPILIDPAIYTSANPTVNCYPPCTFVFPPMTLSTATTIKIPPQTVTYEENWVTTVTVSGAVITTSAASITTTVVTVPAITTKVIDVWDVTYSGSTISGSTYGTINLTMSVEVPPATFTYTNKHTTTSSGGPPIFWTYSPGPWPPIPPTTKPPPGVTTTPIPPPPPPPPPFPPSVTVKTGAPKPTCTSNCGKPCQRNCTPGGGSCFGICGCLGPFCPKPPGCPSCPPGGGCIGPGCSQGGGSSGGGGNDPSSCRTRTTVSTCEVECSVIKYPGTSTTTCERPECSRTITACSATGTTTTTTTTLSCETNPPYPSMNGKDKVPMIGDGGIGGSIIDAGDFKSMTQKPTTTKKPDTPTSKPPSNDPSLPTIVPGSGAPYCFRDHNDKGQYKKFGEAVGDPAIAALCNTDDYLSPDNSFGYAVRAADDLLLSVTWAKDTAGCPRKQNVPIKKDNWCRDTMRVIILACDEGVESDTYGGAFVEKNNDYGCVRWWIGTSQTSAAARRIFTTQPQGNDTIRLTTSQQQIIKEELDRIEPELPMMVRPEEGFGNQTEVYIWS